MNLDLSAVHHSNARRLNEMKTFLLLLLLFVSGPLLCEENSLLGYRLLWNNSKELFNFGRAPDTKAIVYVLVCLLCLLHTTIACLKWRKKQNCVFRGQFTNDRKNSLRQLMDDSRDEKAVENLAPSRDTRGLLIKLKDSIKLEMLVRFILHDMMRIDLRPRRMFIFKLGPVYAVDEILADATKELKPLQEFVPEVSGNPEKSEPITEYKDKTDTTVMKRERSNVKKDSKLKAGVKNMTEMVASVFAPCVTTTQSEDDYESFLYPKIKKITKESTEQFCLPPEGYEQAMRGSFEDKNVICSSERTENVKQTVKTYYIMAGGFASHLRRLSEEGQARKEDEREFRVLQVEMETGNRQDDVVVSETIETATKSQELRFIKDEQKVLGPTCSPGELKAGNIILRAEKKVDTRPKWEYKDYAMITCGMLAFVFISVSVSRFFRR